jgi:hypothetical protein
MKKSILFLCLLFIQGISYSQTMEIIADVSNDKIVTSESILIGDVVYSVGRGGGSFPVCDIKAMNIKTKKEVVKKIKDVDLKYGIIGGQKANLVGYFNFSPGRKVGENVQYLFQTINKEDKLIISQVTFDSNLKVVSEKMLLTYDVANKYQNITRVLKYDDQLNMYYYGDCFPFTGKDDYFRSVIFNAQMEITADEEFSFNFKPTKPMSNVSLLESAKIIDAKTVMVNLEGTLCCVQPKSFKPLPLKLKHDINNYKIQSNGKGGVRLIGNYDEGTNIQGLAIMDFNEILEVSFEKYVKLPTEVTASQKEITGKGERENMRFGGVVIEGFQVNQDGSTDIVLALRNNLDYRLNISFVKIDKEGNIEDHLVTPFGLREDLEILFLSDKIVVLTPDTEDWYEESGKFNSENYPNRKGKNLILTSIVVPNDAYNRFKRSQVFVANAKADEFNWKKQILKFHNVKVDETNYLMTIEVNGPPAIGKVFYTQYIGKISL